MGGIIRGIGLQTKGFIIALVCYYVVGIPLAAVLAFLTQLGLTGTWVGIATCSVTVNISFTVLLFVSQWKPI